MKKKKTEQMEKFQDGYVYTADIVKDLHELVTEYLSEVEHQEGLAACGEISMDACEDVSTWLARRKELLKRDFIMYWNATLK